LRAPRKYERYTVQKKLQMWRIGKRKWSAMEKQTRSAGIQQARSAGRSLAKLAWYCA
jgi:hypothetical protein